MQRVTNAIYINQNHVLMIKKPRRNWYSAPGGKMEFGESITQAVIREFQEETGFTLKNPKLSSVFTFVMDQEEEWMLFTYFSEEADGKLLSETPEGKLEWIPINQVLNLPMAKGDKEIIKHAINQPQSVLSGTFYYSKEFELQRQRLDEWLTKEDRV
ncbi:8-oxo-dGTP diphosphatase [Filobacillus milosensis]|uniref:8-oxo-dGTP diphosphatase n=1 Tax=Filobacillus milosensis TaxID=94137 RepID=A0A4Y8IRD5_9BACI|nr:8-oxo-dGTP diphosphatase [Filobacillus milosensis]TFB24343.1 8-oxo-dGTP diphosphatase [Filobacillus milosensis]